MQEKIENIKEKHKRRAIYLSKNIFFNTETLMNKIDEVIEYVREIGDTSSGICFKRFTLKGYPSMLPRELDCSSFRGNMSCVDCIFNAPTIKKTIKFLNKNFSSKYIKQDAMFVAIRRLLTKTVENIIFRESDKAAEEYFEILKEKGIIKTIPCPSIIENDIEEMRIQSMTSQFRLLSDYEEIIYSLTYEEICDIYNKLREKYDIL